MVALLPGRMTRSETGIGSPGRTKTSRTFGSIRSGSKSSKLAMRDEHRHGDRHRRFRCAALRRRGRRRPPPAGAPRRERRGRGRRRASRCARRWSVMPSANRLASPRNLLTMKPAIIAASSGASAAFVPRICAKMPPRSMSPISDDRAAGGAGEAHVGDVALAQVDLGRAARALDEDEIRLGLEARETVEHGAHQLAVSAPDILAPRVADDAALHDDLRADLALRLQEHRVHVDARARRRRRAPAAPAPGRSRRRRPSPRRCSTCSAA